MSGRAQDSLTIYIMSTNIKIPFDTAGIPPSIVKITAIRAVWAEKESFAIAEPPTVMALWRITLQRVMCTEKNMANPRYLFIR